MTDDNYPAPKTAGSIMEQDEQRITTGLDKFKGTTTALLSPSTRESGQKP